MTTQVKFFAGPAMRPYLSALARLRIAVFRDWPYLYDGVLDAERVHLSELALSPRGGLAVAFDGGEPVGCSTCLPLPEADAAVRAPLLAVGHDPTRFFYFGESVLLRPYRGRGIGVAFFAAREAHARDSTDAAFACFCAVERPAGHPLRPPDAVPLDAFWRRRGYVHHPELVCTMRWKQVESADQVENRLSFWIKPLRSTPGR